MPWSGSLRTLVMAAVMSAAVASTAWPADTKVYIPPDAVNQTDEAGTRLVDAFARFCLQRFPNQTVTGGNGGNDLVPMTPAQVKQYLHDDPGHGWTYRQDDGEYVVTVEDPPYHACAVRRLYADPPKYRFPYLFAIQTWAIGRNRGPMDFLPRQTGTVNGLTISANLAALPAAGGKPREVFMDITTPYPRVQQTEIRLVRQIPPPQAR